MRKAFFLTFCLLFASIMSMAQESRFKANIYNKVYDVEIVMNLMRRASPYLDRRFWARYSDT